MDSGYIFMEGSSSSNIIIATATFYTGQTESEKVRSALALDTIKKAVELGYPILVLDGGSSDDLVMSFEAAGATVKQHKTERYGESRRAAMQEAAKFGKEIIVWTEPEKVSFIGQISRTLVPFTEERADIVIPQRKSLSSYPTVQQYAEQFGNAYFRELCGPDLDVWFGPRVYRRDLLPYFLDYNGSFGDMWEGMCLPLLTMIKDGKKIVSVPVDYEHPKEQTVVEEHDLAFYDKRLLQLNNIVPALRKYWHTLNK